MDRIPTPAKESKLTDNAKSSAGSKSADDAAEVLQGPGNKLQDNSKKNQDVDGATAHFSSVGLKREHWLAPFVITKPQYIKEIVSMAKIKEGDIFYDVGCGAGHVLRYVAENTKAKKIVGIEHNAELAKSSKDSVAAAGLDTKRVSILHADAMTEDMSEASVAYLYLTIGGMKLFEPRLKLMLKNGTRVVSMWPRQFPDEDDEENQVLDATERIRYYDPGAGTFSDKKTHSFGLKIYIWEPISN
eukprot:jgi/Bigna1/86676/estExt_fgenesh1_pg.C_120236